MSDRSREAMESIEAMRDGDYESRDCAEHLYGLFVDESKDSARLAAEVARLSAWLDKIEGGDDPCQDEEQLRTWAYAAGMGKDCPQ